MPALEPAPAERASEPSQLRRSMDRTVWEGVAFTAGSSLTGGIFLAGFAAALGADARVMGILAALPSVAELLQCVGAQIIAHVGHRRTVFIAANTLCASVWAALALMAFLLKPNATLVWTFVAMYGLSSLCNSTRGLAWLDWMRDLVPGALRGRFLAHRNRQTLVAGVALSIPAAWLIDRYRAAHPESAATAFGIVFAVAAALMFAAALVGRRIHEPPMTPPDPDGLWKTALREGWNCRPFRRYFFFRLYICFAMAMTGPLVAFYCLRVLRYSTTLLAGLEVMAVIIGAATLLFWGRLADRVGNRPAMMLTFGLKVIWSGLYVFLTGDSIGLMVLIYIFSAHGPGSVLVHQNMILKLAPEKGTAAALGLFNSITQGAAAAAPILTGFLVASILPERLSILGLSLTSWQQVIIISTVLRTGGVIGLIWVHEPRSQGIGDFVRPVLRPFGLKGQEAE